MAPLLKELSILEVELLEVIVQSPPKSEQDGSLNIITSTPGEITTLLPGTLPANADCCCCCPCCCCVSV